MKSFQRLGLETTCCLRAKIINYLQARVQSEEGLGEMAKNKS